MSNVAILDLKPTQVEKLVEQLDPEFKIRLIKKLEQETWANRLDRVTQKMHQRIKEAKITDKEIDCLCKEVKKEYDEKHCRN